jgi:hypothetical protein
MAAKKPELKHEEGEVLVTSTLLGKTTKKGEPIKVRPFITTPAQVEVHMGAWFPTGDMAGAKIDITVRVPCYIEEISSVYVQTRQLVDKLMGREVKRMSGEED